MISIVDDDVCDVTMPSPGMVTCLSLLNLEGMGLVSVVCNSGFICSVNQLFG